MGPLRIRVSTLHQLHRKDDLQMTSYTPDFLLKHAVPEPGLEFPASCARGGNTSGVLSTADDDVWLERGDDCAVEGRFGGKGLDDGEVLGVVYLEEVSARILGSAPEDVLWRSCPCSK